jgi:3-oxoacyl-[acyl-carrier-protein] synthase II
MASSSRRVVISGIGVISPIGLDRARFWDSLRNGQSGISALTGFDASALPTRFGGEVRGFEGKNYLDKKDRKSLKMMSRTIQFAVAAAHLAIADAGLQTDKLDRTRFGVEFGAGLLASELEELGPAAKLSANCQPGSVDLEKWGADGIPAMQPLWMLKYLPNMLASHVSILHDAQGPNNTITENEVSGILALSEASRIIARDGADVFLVGGADSKLNPLSLVRHSLFMPLSRRNDSPETASRPFDRDRDGVVLGEGGAVFVVEDLEHARRRGAKIYAEILGHGAAFDRRLSGDGLARAVIAALKQAGIGPQDIDHINAHGAGAVESDRWEACGLHRVFRVSSATTPVFAVKSYVGSMGAGGGPTELAASVLALDQGVLPPTLNYQTPDPECPVLVAAKEPRPVRTPYVLKTSFTEMGQCAAVILKKA